MGIRRKRKDRILAGQQQSRIENGHLKRESENAGTNGSRRW